MPGNVNIIHGDCMEAMAKMPDKAYDLAIVDPPYGGGATPPSEDTSKDTKLMGGVNTEWEQKGRSRFGGIFNKYKIKTARTSGGYAEKYGSKVKHWDLAPSEEYFNELARVSKNQIIWGGNYFLLPPTRCFLVWRKLTISESFTMAMCEYAWTSFNDNAKWIEIAPQGTCKEERFHPTQKPIKLYKWCLQNYVKPGDKILDTHGGSCSLAIACHDMGFDCDIYEIDKDYYDAAVKRFNNHQKQGRLF